MASCPKCGRHKLPKRHQDKKRYCPKCGVLAGIRGYLRNGDLPMSEPTRAGFNVAELGPDVTPAARVRVDEMRPQPKPAPYRAQTVVRIGLAAQVDPKRFDDAMRLAAHCEAVMILDQAKTFSEFYAKRTSQPVGQWAEPYMDRDAVTRHVFNLAGEYIDQQLAKIRNEEAGR